jgi:hypothetical protein
MPKPSFSFKIPLPSYAKEVSTPPEDDRTIPAAATSDSQARIPNNDFNKNRITLIWKRVQQTGIFEDLPINEKNKIYKRLNDWFYTTYVDSEYEDMRDAAIYLTAEELAHQFIRQEQRMRRRKAV